MPVIQGGETTLEVGGVSIWESSVDTTLSRSKRDHLWELGCLRKRRVSRQ